MNNIFSKVLGKDKSKKGFADVTLSSVFGKNPISTGVSMLTNSKVGKKLTPKNGVRFNMRTPNFMTPTNWNWKKKHIPEEVNKRRKNFAVNSFAGVKLNAPSLLKGPTKKDWDGDGVPNKRDCQPRNIMRQDASQNYDYDYSKAERTQLMNRKFNEMQRRYPQLDADNPQQREQLLQLMEKEQEEYTRQNKDWLGRLN